jgi:hypothetical protein
LRRSYLLLIVGMTFFCGFMTAHLIQGYVWNQGIQVSIDLTFAKPTSPEQTPAPPSPESAPAPALSLASPPQSQVSGIPRETVEKKLQPGEDGTKQAPGFQDAGQVLSGVARSKEPVAAPPLAATTQTPDVASRPNEVAGVHPQEETRSTKEGENLPPGPQPKEAQATVPDANHPQETGADATKNFPAASANDVALEKPAAEVLPAKVVVQKGDSLGKFITQYYPGQEKLGLEATILANPEISRENVIYPGQALNLPRIDVSAQAIQLQDQQFYALYGRYYSAASWEGDKPWLEKNQVRFLVRETRESTGRVIHRVFLGGYETVSDLKEAQRRLLTKGRRAWQERDPDSPVVSGATTRQEEAFAGAAPAGDGHRSPNPAPAVEPQPDPVSPGSSAALEVKGAARPEAREMAAGQSPLEPRFEDGHPRAPLKQFITFVKNTAAGEWIICRGRNVAGFLRYLTSMKENRQNLPPGKFLAEGNAGGRENSLKVSPEIFPSEKAETTRPEPSPEGGCALSSSPLEALHHKGEALVNALLSRYREILGVLLDNQVSHFPEHLLQPVPSRETPPGETDFLSGNGEFQKNVENAGYQALTTWGAPGEQEPLMPPVEPDSPEKALPAGTIRRYWDACGVLHIVNGELNNPNSGIAAYLAAKLEQAQPSEIETAENPSLVRNVSWPGQDPNPLPPVGLNTVERILPPVVEGSIRGSLDAKGVLHIVNGEPKGPAPAAPATSAENQEKANEGPNRPVKPVSFPIDDQLPPAPLPGSAAKALPPMEEGAIRRYRDANGVLHIKTVEYPKPEPVAAQLLPGQPPAMPDAGARPWVSPVPVQEGQGVPKLANSEVVAFRDPNGRLVIRSQEMEAKGARVVRWEEAMAQLAPIIQEASLLYGLPVPLIQAVIKAESNFYCWAVSPKGAMGLMQLMPETAASLGVKDPFNPRENIHGGCRYLRLMLDNLRGSLPLALAAYNAGYQRVVSCGFQIPPIKETQGFVTEVLGRYLAAQNMGTDAAVKSGHILPAAAITPK